MNTVGHREFILAGTGGQGLIFAAILLAEAAMDEGCNVLQTQSYGIASRGGMSIAEVIVDTSEIVFQQVLRPDAVVALTEEAVEKYETWAAQDVPMIYDDSLAIRRDGPNFVGYGFTRMADEAGAPDSTNIVALGALVARTAVVRPETLQALLACHFKGPAREINLRLLSTGLALGQEPVR